MSQKLAFKCNGHHICNIKLGTGCSHGEPHKENKECYSGCYTVNGAHCEPIDELELEVNMGSMENHFFEMWRIYGN